MIITFDRRGFANNSSSSHSIIFSPNLKKSEHDEVNEYSYGWETFTITSAQEIEKYLFVQLWMNISLDRNQYKNLNPLQWFRIYMEK